MELEYITGLIREYINEISIEKRNEKLILSNTESKNFITKKNGQLPWTKTIEGDITCFSIYQIKKFHDDVISPIEIIKSIKDPSTPNHIVVHKNFINDFLNLCIEISLPWILNKEFDCVVTPQSSKTLAVKFAKLISSKIDANIIPAVTIKDLDSATLSNNLPSGYSKDSVMILNKSLQRMRASKEKSLHKNFLPKDRKHIIGWQKSRLKNEQMLSGKNILIIDDVIADGSTIREMSRLLTDLGANSIHCLTIFKTS